MKILTRLLLAVACLAPLGAAQAYGCVCEHYGSPYDGLCEASPQQEYYYGEAGLPMWRYEWIGLGSAQFPWPNDEYSNLGYYTCPRGKACGMKFRLYYRFSPLAGYSESYAGEYQCALGTGGG